MKIENFIVGSDPELFIVDTKKDKIISSIGLIPGEKGAAYHPANLPEGFGLQIDNILAEFNIPPTNNEEDFVTSMNVMKEFIRGFVKLKNPDYDILCRASAFVDEDQLQSDEAKLFGCSPDFNAWKLCQNPKPNGDSTNLRSTGCHIHVGFDDPTDNICLDLIRTMDLFLGVPSVLLDPDTDRRKLYGKAGCFRFTPYGVEYRTLSGYFISNDNLIRWCFRQTIKAIEFVNAGNTVNDDRQLILKAIDKCDTGTAITLIKKYNIEL